MIRRLAVLLFSSVVLALYSPGCNTIPCVPEDQITLTTPRTTCSCQINIDYCKGPQYSETMYERTQAVDWCDACRIMKRAWYRPDIIAGEINLWICSCDCLVLPTIKGAWNGTDNAGQLSCDALVTGYGGDNGAGGDTDNFGGSDVGTSGAGANPVTTVGVGASDSTSIGVGASDTTSVGEGAGNARR